jgi:predicted glycoside hydrolase/deacetylase ChbG (UPF0249 family)
MPTSNGLTAREKLELLGYPPDTRLLIINADDLGMCQAENAATFAVLEDGIGTSASLMVPCPWSYDACTHLRANPQLDVGVHLTFTSEWDTYKWGPVSDACPSLCDEHGFFFPSEAEAWAHVKEEEILPEAEAQIERAMQFGLDPSHLDGHMDTVYGDPRFLSVYISLARRYHLPIRMLPRSWYQQRRKVEAYDEADLGTIVTIDDKVWVPLQDPDTIESRVLEALRALRPGITEMGLHASTDTPEARAIMRDLDARVEALRLMTESAAVRQEIERQGIVRIGWRQLRDVQRELPMGGGA